MKTPQLPFPKLSATLGVPNEIWLKREDLHKYGSHKGRSIPLMIDEYKKQGVTSFIISSSGNAALAAVLAVQSHNRNNKGVALSLTILVGKKIDARKLQHLKSIIHGPDITTAKRNPVVATRRDSAAAVAEAVTMQQVDNPKQTAFQMEKEGKGKWLRQSTDDLALTGYAELAQELAKIPNLSAVFIPTSSGTTAQGLYQAFHTLNLNPQIHIVQTTSCHPIVDAITQSVILSVSEGSKNNERLDSSVASLPQNDNTERSLATAIVDRVAFRKEAVSEAIKNSHGYGWIASNDDIQAAQKLAKETAAVDLSPNSALSLVGLTQAVNSGWKWEGAVVCLVTGK